MTLRFDLCEYIVPCLALPDICLTTLLQESTTYMFGNIKQQLLDELRSIEEAGLYKRERVITSPQGPQITVAGRSTPVLNFCANNYLGLSSHPEMIAAAHRALDEHGFGMSSVRFICGTQDIHLELERKIAEFCHTDDAILYAACFDANGGVFESLLGTEDAIISDALNHASIIDGVRLCKAKRYRYESCNMTELEQQLQQAKADGVRNIMIALPVETVYRLLHPIFYPRCLKTIQPNEMRLAATGCSVVCPSHGQASYSLRHAPAHPTQYAVSGHGVFDWLLAITRL